MYATRSLRTLAAVTALTLASASSANAATCDGGKPTIVPLPLPSGAYRTFLHAAPGTKIYSYDLITAHDGKTTQTFIPTAKISCDFSGVVLSANGTISRFPPTVTLTASSLRTYAVFPGLLPTADQAAQLRMGRTRLVRTVTTASAAAADAATPVPTPSTTPSPKHKRFL